MSLSDKEREELAKLENVFYTEDPDFVKNFHKEQNKTTSQILSKKFFLYGILFILGVVLLLVGVAVKFPIIGVCGFIVMLGAFAQIYRSRTPTHKDFSGQKVSAHNKNKKFSRKQSFMERFEQRWEDRQQERDEKN